MFEDDVKITFQDLPVLVVGDKKDSLTNISMNFEDLILGMGGLIDDLKGNKSALSNQTEKVISDLKSLLDNRKHHIDKNKYNKAIKEVNEIIPYNEPASMNGEMANPTITFNLRKDELDKKAIFTDSYLLKVYDMTKKLLDTYVAHDLDKSNSIDKETASRITFFNKLDKDEI